MNRNHHDGTYDSDDAAQPDVPSQHKDRLLAAHENDITRRESAVIDYEAAVLNREKLVTARENAVGRREAAAQLREEKAASHEQGIRAAETIKAATDEHMTVLQQANAHLVITTIEAQKLAEQLQTIKAQLEYACFQ